MAPTSTIIQQPTTISSILQIKHPSLTSRMLVPRTLPWATRTGLVAASIPLAIVGVIFIGFLFWCLLYLCQCWHERADRKGRERRIRDIGERVRRAERERIRKYNIPQASVGISLGAVPLVPPVTSVKVDEVQTPKVCKVKA